MDPHGAVGYLALKKYLEENPQKSGIFLETAHPAKFSETVESAIGKKIEMPAGTNQLFTKKQYSTLLEADYKSFKNLLLQF